MIPRETFIERGFVLDRERPMIMGVLNVTPDSFSDGGNYSGADRARAKAVEMVRHGADIVDIGGESSRPGSMPVSIEEELKRVIPAVKAVRADTEALISVDTYKSEVARRAIEEGASIVNDITALGADEDMAEVIYSSGAGVILMHMKGTPLDMQDDPSYDDLLGEIKGFLRGAMDRAKAAGIDPDKIAVDPGIGFGKTVRDNLLILRSLKELKTLGRPVLVGTSRKAFIGEVTGRRVNERKFGTAATVAAAVLNGADIVRVHDVREMIDVVNMAEAIVRV